MKNIQNLLSGSKTNILGLALIGYYVYQWWQQQANGGPMPDLDVGALGAGLLTLRAAIAKVEDK
jgi:hypothetical protein